ncbi:4-amino-4-deoxy-L-arabinose transferase [Isosphaeraceae bacterium EP7]
MGLAVSVLLNSLLGLGAWIAARSCFRQRGGLPRAIAAGVLAWSWAVLGVEVLGATGFLGRWPLVGWATLGLATGIGGRLVRGTLDEPDAGLPAGKLGPIGVASIVSTWWACLVLLTPSLVYGVKVVSDGPIYHLYFAVRWWKAEALTLVPIPFGESAATYFPAAGDAWFAWLVAGYGGEQLAKVGQAPFLILAGFAAYGLARRMGASADSSALASAWFLTGAPLLLFGFEPNVDVIFVAAYLASAYFFARFALGDDGAASLALGALSTGGAWATKPTGTVFVPPMLALIAWSVARQSCKSARTRRLELATLFGWTLVIPAYWWARNVWLTGNPLYPLQIRVGGLVLLSGWFDSEAMTRSVYYRPMADWRAFVDILAAVTDPRMLPLWFAAILFGIGSRRARPVLTWICVGAIANVALYWLLIPYRTQQRFMLQGIGLAVAPLALLLDRSTLLRWLGLVLLVAHLITPQTWPFANVEAAIPWDLSPQIPNMVPAMVDIGRQTTARVEHLWLGFGAALIGLSWLWASARPTVTRRWVASLVPLGVILAAVAVDWPAGKASILRFYPSFRDHVGGWLALEERMPSAGARIAYAGTNIPYYLFGQRLRNDVRYVNVDDHADWLMHDYHRRGVAEGLPNWPNSRPGWDRMHPDYAAWLANLEQAGIQILVTTRVNLGEGEHNAATPDGFPIEEAWAVAHPESFEPIHGAADGDRLFHVYRVKSAGPRSL